VNKLRSIYIEGQRDHIIFGLSGFLAKTKFSKQSIIDLVSHLCDLCNDDQKDQRINVVNMTYQKWMSGEEITGFNHLLQILTKSFENIC
jgi:hypothetical protein